MNDTRSTGLGRLNAYQVAGLAILSSAAAAAAVSLLLRRFVFTGPDPALDPYGQPGVATVPTDGIPTHFSESLIVPGITESASEISEQDATQGRSPEGV